MAESTAWIKCKERQPPYGKSVLVYMGTGVYVAERVKTDGSGDWWKIMFDNREWNTTTHWRELPGKPDEF